MPKKENKFASIYRCLLMHDMVDCSNAQKFYRLKNKENKFFAMVDLNVTWNNSPRKKQLRHPISKHLLFHYSISVGLGAKKWGNSGIYPRITMQTKQFSSLLDICNILVIRLVCLILNDFINNMKSSYIKKHETCSPEEFIFILRRYFCIFKPSILRLTFT